MDKPRILTTIVGSYPVPDWFLASPSEQTRLDATRVVFDIQRQAGIDLPTDGELYRFDFNHPETNGMIEYFLRPLSGIRTEISRSEWDAYFRLQGTGFRRRPPAVVTDEIGEGFLNLFADCTVSAEVAGGPFKFTVTSPYMLSRLVLDNHYHDAEALAMAFAKVLARQVERLPCACVQLDEANLLLENLSQAPVAAKAINVVLDSVTCQRAVHLCFGNYGGQPVRKGDWSMLIDFLNLLHADHLVLETAHRPTQELQALKGIDPRIKLGVGVIDIKINHVETPEEIARRIDAAEKILGPSRVGWVHPDCGFWMLKRPVVDAKIAALVKGRDLYLGSVS
ncbi:MAG TPA: cobalamin-independent methionine synthase II family protein [Terriglobia bacterium]|nr:cobalamin-independent methionine synthase II family protein [Terriglobia bacterium]